MDLFTLTALKAFDSSGYNDFFVLHLVTSFRSLKMSIRTLCGIDGSNDRDVTEEDARTAANGLNFFWRAVVCSYIAVGRPTILNLELDTMKREEEVAAKERNGPIASSWQDVIDGVMPSRDEHLVKFAFVCWQEALEHKDCAAKPEWQEYCRRSASNTTLRFNGTKNWHYT